MRRYSRIQVKRCCVMSTWDHVPCTTNCQVLAALGPPSTSLAASPQSYISRPTLQCFLVKSRPSQFLVLCLSPMTRPRPFSEIHFYQHFICIRNIQIVFIIFFSCSSIACKNRPLWSPHRVSVIASKLHEIGLEIAKPQCGCMLQSDHQYYSPPNWQLSLIEILGQPRPIKWYRFLGCSVRIFSYP